MIDINIRKVNNFIVQQIPQQIISHIIQNVILIYQSSYDYVFDSKEKEQAIDLLYHERRANIESFLKLLPNKFPEINVDCKINKSFNHYHVEISINDITLTQSFTQYKDEKIRNAKFRQSLSKFNNQIEMDFPNEKSISKSKEKNIYAIINHGAEGRESQRPQFFQLVLPTIEDEVTMDILELYDISPKVLQAEIEDIKSGKALIYPILKRIPKTGESE